MPPVAGALLFTLHDAANGTYLWRTDGTAAGTTVVKRLDADLVWTQGTAVTATGLSVFSFYDEGSITEVWRTDGTPGGTVRLDSFGGYVRFLGALGGYVYVASGTTDGSALKISRVSLAGGGKATATWLPNRYAGQPDAYPYVEYSAVAGGKLYVSMAIGTSGPAPREVGLWVTDGTEAGTRELSRGLFTGDENYSPLFDTGVGTLLFSADDGGTGLEPWVTDGTPGRTGLVADLSPLGAPTHRPSPGWAAPSSSGPALTREATRCGPCPPPWPVPRRKSTPADAPRCARLGPCPRRSSRSCSRTVSASSPS